MTESTPNFAVLGALLNPTTSTAKAKAAVELLQSRVEDMDIKMKIKVLHALKGYANANA
jgi:hypothetical protein